MRGASFRARTRPSRTPRPAGRRWFGRWGGFALVALSLAVVLLAPTPAQAINDPALEWYTIETAHFRVHYPHPLENAARRVATLCETVHERVSRDMAFLPDQITEVVVTDFTDSANGSATPVPYNTMRLFVTAPGDLSTLGDYDDWMLMLITHEYTHILHTGNISGLPSIANAILGRTYAPNAAQPRWVIEGLAVVLETEQTSGGRVRSSLFDAFLRADAIEGTVPTLDQMSGNPIRWPQANAWYLHGARFLRWISDVYGPDAMPAVSADYSASVAPFGVNRAIRRVTGRTYDQLYDAWIDHLERHYAEQLAVVERRGLREGVRITDHGRFVAYPRFVTPEARTEEGRDDELLYYRNDQHERQGLYRLHVGDLQQPGSRDAELIARTQGSSNVAFTPEGGLIFPSVDVFRNVYARNDLFYLPKGETSTFGTEDQRVRITSGMRTMEADVAPDGRTIAFTVNQHGTTYLEVGRLTPERAIAERRTLVPSEKDDQAFTPRFSPDGRHLAYSVWTRGGFRDIRVVEVASGRYWQITRDRAVDMQPVWSPDGKTLYFSSDRTGIFNIYAFDLATARTRQVTNVRTLAIMPTIDARGESLVYVGYTNRGYDLYAMRLEPARFLDAPPPPSDRPSAPPEPRPIEMVKKRYDPLPTFGPRAYTVDVGPGRYDPNALTLAAVASDVVGLHAGRAEITFDPGAPAPRFSVGYNYLALPVDLGVAVAREVVPRGGYFVGGRERVYDETALVLSSGLSYPINWAFVSQSLSLTYSAQFFSGDLPFDRRVDPQSPATVLPPQGYLGVVRAGYSLSTAEGSIDTPGPARGVALRTSVGYAGPPTGSEETLYTFETNLAGWVSMPWPGYQVLALRTSGGISAGTYARRSFFFVGGYDIDREGLFSALSGRFDGAFVLRGYQPFVYRGSAYLQGTAEYRAPLLFADVGLSTLPLYLRRIDAALFVDYGGAFERLDLERMGAFRNGAIIDSENLHSSVGGELWLGATLAHRVDANFRVGYAYGFSEEAIEGGQLYLVMSGAF